jgi:murein DD-endopeptidase MepM/ murein hydrolase activator NlpD
MTGLLFYQAKYAKPTQVTQGNNLANVQASDQTSDEVNRPDTDDPLELADDLQAYESGFIELDLLARRVGILEAESLRLNAFSSRIITIAKLDPEEFSFDAKPSLGGRPVSDVSTVKVKFPETPSTELMGTIRLLETDLKEQRNRLKKITDVLQGRILKHNEAAPTGRPVMHGYISSLYGMRRDPFTGKHRMHQGVDFAAKIGTKVLAIGSGVVSFSGKKGAYGNVVEVTHGKGVVSRYAHLSKMLVNVGERVVKGKEIAEIGSTGRSTGAHLHLEVLKKGKREDPNHYISSSKMP